MLTALVLLPGSSPDATRLTEVTPEMASKTFFDRRCPHCQRCSPTAIQWLGRTMACPNCGRSSTALAIHDPLAAPLSSVPGDLISSVDLDDRVDRLIAAAERQLMNSTALG
jgi:hypothetical protein